MKRKSLLWAVLLAPLALSAVAAISQAPAPVISAAVADASRPEADKARDANRKPAEVIAFAGLRPGDKVADLIPGSGYFTRIFAKVVGPTGKVYAAVPLALASRPGVMDNLNAIAKDNPNVWAGPIDYAKLEFPEPLDMVWTSENYHDFHNIPNGDVVALNQVIFKALKPGGVYLVVDHAAAAGSPLTVADTLHRIDPAIVKQEVAAAGFKFDGESPVLRNPADPHTALVFDPSIRGKTDQFVYKFSKPK